MLKITATNIQSILGSYVAKASQHKTQKTQKEHYSGRPRQHNLKRLGKSFESNPQAHDSKSIWDSIKDGLDAFYRFSRPHTIIGTVKLKLL